MKLSFQEVRVTLFVLNHAVEQSLGAFVLCLDALHGFVVLAYRIMLVFEVNLNLLLYVASKLRLQSDFDSG